MATGTYQFYPKFTEVVNMYQPIHSVYIGDGTIGDNNKAGVLYVVYDNGVIHEIGPVSSYAEAVQAGVAGEGTAFDTPAKWIAHIAAVTLDALKAEGWAVGTQNGVPVESGVYFHNNSKYWAEQSANEKGLAETARDKAEQAQTKAEEAQQAAETAKSHAEDFEDSSEAWAVGTINNTPVESTDPRYQNNSKYYAEYANIKASAASASANDAEASNQRAASHEEGAERSAQAAAQSKQAASESESNAATSEENAAESEKNAEAWAIGTKSGVPVASTDPEYQNNSKYYSEYARNKVDEFSRAVEKAVTVYQNSTSGRVRPTGPWTSDPHPESGRYMWVKTTFTWMNGSTTDAYSVSYIGANGTGSVNSVNGAGGDVVLDGKLIDLDSSDPNTPTIYEMLANYITTQQIYALFT